MGKSFVHPKTKQVFTVLENGTIEVQDPSGAAGGFKRDGTWLSVELRDGDAVMCDFGGGTYKPGSSVS